jgi:type IV pilus assembly protein PilB
VRLRSKDSRSPAPVEAPAQPRVAQVAQAPADLTVGGPGGARGAPRLVEAGLVTRGQVVAALQAPGAQRLGQRLVESGAVTERDIAWTVAQQRGLETVDLSMVTPAPEATALLDEHTARTFNAIPLALYSEDGRGEVVALALADPDAAAMAALGAAIDRPLRIMVATPSDIQRAIGNSYRALTGVSMQVRAFEAAHVPRRDTARAAEAIGDDAPVVQVVSMIITQALRDRASDVHIEPHDDRIRVRYRIDGALHDVLDLPAAMGPVVCSRIKILGGMNIVERRRPQDGQISMEIEGRELDIRVSTTAVVDGEKVVLRLLDKSRELLRLEHLGMPEEMVRQYRQVLRSPYGMVVCAGPTGSGKTTTLYGSLGEINTPERNVMTIEDPVEYRVPSINQIQINEQAGITFAGGLRSILRQDPDVILVGEVRDVETARIAVQSALTGHFVLSSVHATDAPAALHRLLDMGIESFLVASSLTAVLAQRLVRRVCPHCTETYRPAPEELALLRAIGGGTPEMGFVRGRGCNFCARTGYLERIGVYEMMIITESVREMVLARASHDEIRKVARSEGMRTLPEQAGALVRSGVTNLPEVLRSIYVMGA